MAPFGSAGTEEEYLVGRESAVQWFRQHNFPEVSAGRVCAPPEYGHPSCASRRAARGGVHNIWPMLEHTLRTRLERVYAIRGIAFQVGRTPGNQYCVNRFLLFSPPRRTCW